jgi:acetyl-CoA synthetase
MAQKDIQSVLHEDRVFPPSAQFRKSAALKSGELERMYASAAEDYIGFWAGLARSEIDWQRPFTVALDDAEAPNYRWFADGQLNVSHNCLDVHLGERGDKIAILFEGEPGDVRKLTYAELHGEVCRFANALKDLAVGRGDRVVIYMPLIPEAVIAMQACARIGAVHSVVFGGFSANAVKDRIEDAGAKLVITADGGWRGGHAVELKRAVDKALSSFTAARAVAAICGPAAIYGGMTPWPAAARLASPNGWTRSTRCSCCTRPGRPAGQRASSTRAAAICSTPR